LKGKKFYFLKLFFYSEGKEMLYSLNQRKGKKNMKRKKKKKEYEKNKNQLLHRPLLEDSHASPT